MKRATNGNQNVERLNKWRLFRLTHLPIRVSPFAGPKSQPAFLPLALAKMEIRIGTTMGARCHRRLAWLSRCFGAASIIAVCAGSLAGSPQFHEHINRHGAGLIHSYAVAVSKANKSLQAIRGCAGRTVFAAPAPIISPAPRAVVTTVWVPKLFLEACRCEHGPPVLC